MREPGWYWVKYYEGARWDICEFDYRGIWLVNGHYEQDGYFRIVGPKIEQPKEQSDE